MLVSKTCRDQGKKIQKTRWPRTEYQRVFSIFWFWLKLWNHYCAYRNIPKWYSCSQENFLLPAHNFSWIYFYHYSHRTTSVCFAHKYQIILYQLTTSRRNGSFLHCLTEGFFNFVLLGFVSWGVGFFVSLRVGSYFGLGCLRIFWCFVLIFFHLFWAFILLVSWFVFKIKYGFQNCCSFGIL